MYVCMCMCVYVCVCACVCMSVYVHVCVSMCVCMYVSAVGELVEMFDQMLVSTGCTATHCEGEKR